MLENYNNERISGPLTVDQSDLVGIGLIWISEIYLGLKGVTGLTR